MLEQISRTYDLLRRYVDMAAALDRALALTPNNSNLRVNRALADVSSRGDIQPFKNTLRSLVADKTHAAHLAFEWLELARYERNWDDAARALSVMPADGCREESLPFPRTWCEGTVARFRGDGDKARSAFIAARAEVEEIVKQQPENASALCVLGLIDAALGHRRDAVRESKRAVELLPVAKDSVDGARMIKYLALTYAWAGKKDAALTELGAAVKIPGYLSYGELKLDPMWDPLRGDPRFDKIVASLAPK
jgi:tetratricopeptide (TPR) repeat protein